MPIQVISFELLPNLTKINYKNCSLVFESSPSKLSRFNAKLVFVHKCRLKYQPEYWHSVNRLSAVCWCPIPCLIVLKIGTTVTSTPAPWNIHTGYFSTSFVFK